MLNTCNSTIYDNYYSTIFTLPEVYAKAAILKFSTPAIITSCKLIIVEYEAVLQFNQSTLLHTITGAIIIRMFKLLDILYNHIKIKLYVFSMFYPAEFGRNISGSLERKYCIKMG